MAKRQLTSLRSWSGRDNQFLQILHGLLATVSVVAMIVIGAATAAAAATAVGAVAEGVVAVAEAVIAVGAGAGVEVEVVLRQGLPMVALEPPCLELSQEDRRCMGMRQGPLVATRPQATPEAP
mmetsp:Transcript_55888/g.120917  ORF Transcript_55888/g.120917 Transcript_55888/m.120917 type:complete len:123 (-) Transcript_55888:161-529(-)